MKSTKLLAVIISLLTALFISSAGLAGHGGEKAAGHHSAAWKQSLDKAQKDKLKKMKVDFLKLKFPLKARIKTIKIDLAILAMADTPDQKAIDAKIDELLALKKQILKSKYAFKVSIRKELKPEQRAGFDKHQLKRAKRNKCHKKNRH